MKKLLGGFGIIPGASYPLRALNLFIHHPRLWKYTLIPILVNVVVGLTLYFGLFSFGWYEINLFLEALRDNWVNFLNILPEWLRFLDFIWVIFTFLLRFFLVTVLLFVIGFIMVQFGILLGAPWYGILSEEVEKERLGQAENIEVSIIKDLWRAILFELKKVVIILVGLILLFLGSFLGPIGAIVSFIIKFVSTSTIICLDFFDGPLERRRYSFRRKLKIVFRSFPGGFGFAVACAILISIPLVNFVSIPLCVSAGTLFFCDRIFPRRD